MNKELFFFIIRNKYLLIQIKKYLRRRAISITPYGVDEEWEKQATADWVKSRSINTFNVNDRCQEMTILKCNHYIRTRYDDYHSMMVMAVNGHLGLLKDKLKRNRHVYVSVEGILQVLATNKHDVELFNIIFNRYRYTKDTFFNGDMVMAAACFGGNLQIIKRLSEYHKLDQSYLTNSKCLVMAVKGGNHQAVDFLLDMNTSVLEKSDVDLTILLLSSLQHRHSKVFQSLINYKVDQYIKNSNTVSIKRIDNYFLKDKDNNWLFLVDDDIDSINIVINTPFISKYLPLIIESYIESTRLNHSFKRQLQILELLLKDQQQDQEDELNDMIKVHKLIMKWINNKYKEDMGTTDMMLSKQRIIEDLVKDGSREMIKRAINLYPTLHNTTINIICQFGTVDTLKIAIDEMTDRLCPWYGVSSLELHRAIVRSNVQLAQYLVDNQPNCLEMDISPLMLGVNYPPLTLDIVQFVASIDNNKFGRIIGLPLSQQAHEYIVGMSTQGSTTSQLLVTLQILLVDHCGFDDSTDTTNIIQFIKLNNSKIPDLLYQVAKYGSPNLVKIVMEKLNLNFTHDTMTWGWAGESGCTDIFKMLVENEKKTKYHIDYQRFTNFSSALNNAAAHNRLGIIELYNQLEHIRPQLGDAIYTAQKFNPHLVPALSINEHFFQQNQNDHNCDVPQQRSYCIIL